MKRIHHFLSILFFLIPLNSCITVVAQTPDSVGMPQVLREEAKEQLKKGTNESENFLVPPPIQSKRATRMHVPQSKKRRRLRKKMLLYSARQDGVTDCIASVGSSYS